MPTIAEHIGSLEQARRGAERRQSDADASIKRLLRKAEADGRENLTETEDQQLRELTDTKRSAQEEISRLDGRLEEARRVEGEEAEVLRLAGEVTPTGAGRRSVEVEAGPRFVRLSDGRPATVQRGQRFADHPVVSEYAAARSRADEAVVGQHGILGNQLRAMTTTSGSAVVPTVWASDIIDRARNMAAVLRAGAQITPMDAKVVQIGRLTTDPTAAFRTEGSTVTASDPVFDNVTLTATTMSALVIGSMEWFQDAPNVDEVVANAIAKAVALQLDLVALYGGVTSGGEGINLANPPNPRGVLATLLAVAASSVLGGAANGTSQTAATFYNEVVDTIYTPRDNNESPNALLWPSRLARKYAEAYDTTNQPLRQPPDVEQITKYISNQVASGFSQGHRHHHGRPVRGRLVPADRRPAAGLHRPDPRGALRWARPGRHHRPLARRHRPGPPAGVRGLPLPQGRVADGPGHQRPAARPGRPGARRRRPPQLLTRLLTC
jgi:HK97 family phage major capsid protein